MSDLGYATLLRAIDGHPDGYYVTVDTDQPEGKGRIVRLYRRTSKAVEVTA